MAAPAYGVSVTQRINGIKAMGIPAVKQPRGGYIKPKEFDCVELPDMKPLLDHTEENINAGLVGLAVDYLTRFLEGSPVEEAFKISHAGAGLIDETDKCENILANITGYDDASITAACQAAGYDVLFRAGPMGYKPVEEILPNKATIYNIQEMVSRSRKFFQQYGPVVLDGMTFEGGYTPTIATGDGDFMTADTIWDFKVSVKPPTNKHTLQLLIYWRLGLHSIHPEYQQVEKLGFFNPRLGTVYTLPVDRIPAEVIQEVESEVIGY
ncbi:hypothetical protein [Adlercreutzia sp. ZJ138]|uniref:hypothetical protein n=1 Tax=Adlercreutzia sp. ZJ138 TaxID=2709405 RepID=UPI0019820D3A|nr:hypothetical protein [Adlercreutzia sp. ZJ138]